jgi:anti-sigma regulatory factor (Ser/Thr protein kinase)
VESYARFRRTTDQVPAARAFVEETLTRWGETAAVVDAVLVTSELFTNAVLHGSGWVDVHLSLDHHAVRIAVVDDGRERPTMAPGPLPATALTGRGLRIVDALTSEWGDNRDPTGRTRVWAEVSR